MVLLCNTIVLHPTSETQTDQCDHSVGVTNVRQHFFPPNVAASLHTLTDALRRTLHHLPLQSVVLLQHDLHVKLQQLTTIASL